MRSDAQQNHERIVAAAIEVFSAGGTEASLELVAKRAGVGTGTLYRHFATREDLLDAVMRSWIERIQDASARAVESADPPRLVLLAWCRDVVAQLSWNRGGPARFLAALGNPDSPIAGKCQVLVDANADVLARVASEDALRPDVDSIDVCRLVGAVAMAADQGELDAATVDHLLGVVVDGLVR